MNRYSEEIREEMRQDIKPKLRRTIKANPSAYKLARFVDDQPLDRMIINSYSEYETNINRTVEDDPAVEKNRGTYGSGYHPAEIPLATPFEKIYFDLLGQGINGHDHPSPLGEQYVCRCGLKFATSGKMMPTNCPVCGDLTPRGRLDAEAPTWYKR